MGSKPATVPIGRMVGTSDGRKARWTTRSEPFSRNMFPIARSRNSRLETEKWDGPARERNPALTSTRSG